MSKYGEKKFIVRELKEAELLNVNRTSPTGELVLVLLALVLMLLHALRFLIE